MNKNCPRCEKPMSDYPALSRGDNSTKICSNCGTEEALQGLTLTKREFFEHTIQWMEDAGLDAKKVRRRIKECEGE